MRKELKGHKNWVRSFAFSRNGDKIVSGSFDTNVRIWNISGNQKIICEGHSDYITSVAFSQEKDNIVSGSNDKTIIL